MIITSMNWLWAVRRLWFQRRIIWVSFRYEYEEERGFFVLYLSQARLSCSRAVRARERSRISLSLPFDGRRWCWRWLHNIMSSFENWTLWCTLCKMSQKLCLLGECIFSQQRERERKREKVFRALLLLLLREGDDDQYFLVSLHWNPSFFFFVCFDGSLWWRTCSEPICRGRRSMPKEGGVERRLFFLPSFRILSCATFVVSARVQRRWWRNTYSEASRRIWL